MVGTTANSISVNWPSKFLSFSGKTSTTSPVKFHQGPSGNGEPVTRFHLRCREVKRSEEFSTQTEETSNFSYFFIFQMLLLFFFSTFFFLLLCSISSLLVRCECSGVGLMECQLLQKTVILWQAALRILGHQSSNQSKGRSKKLEV